MSYVNQWNDRQFKFSFVNCERIQETFSYTYQDIFVATVLQGKISGTYLEIGCGTPVDYNNTYLLTKYLSWNGISIDYNASLDIEWLRQRPQNKFIAGNALTLDYDKILSTNYPHNRIDYLQLDIEPPQQTLEALLRLPLSKYRFNVITFETDWYTGGASEYVRQQQRQVLHNLGYSLIVGDVLHDGKAYEDWWVDLDHVDKNVALKIQSLATNEQRPEKLLLI